MTTLPFELETAEGTGSTGVGKPRSPTMTMASLTRSFGILRDETSVLDADVGNDHRSAQLETLDLVARDRAREEVASLLEELFVHRGLGWSDIARLVGVSVQAVRKWRQLQPITGENRLAVARIAALLDLLEAVPVQDPVGWLEIPVLAGYSLRHIDLYRSDRNDLLFDLAHLRITPQQAMSEILPDWQQALRLEHEVFDADDGHRSIRHLG